MKCIIIEDQPPAQRILRKYIADYGGMELLRTFTDPIEALDYLKINRVELIFLDIHLPKISGIDFLKTLQKPPLVILTTAFPNFAIESYEFSVLDYLLKPFSFPRFIKAVSKAKGLTEKSSGKSTEYIFIKSGHEFIKVSIADIFFIKSDSDYTEILLPNSKLLSSESLKHWEKELAAQDFLRVHKSFLINFKKVVKVKTGSILLEGKLEAPIGRAYKDAVSERVLK